VWSLVTNEQGASTLHEYQVAILPQIEHRGYYYFPFQDNPPIATQFSGVFWPSEIPIKFLCRIDRRAESTAVSSLPYESIREQILSCFNSSYAIQERIQTHSYDELIDTSSTYTRQISSSDPQIEQSAINIFDAYQHEEFDTDIAYEFTNALDRLIRANGKPAVLTINSLIKKLVLDHDIVSETLKALGRIEDENTKDQRYQLLIGSIKNESALIRDGAVSGLSFLHDKRVLPQLRMLFETETVPILKNNIRVAIKGLETY